MANKSIDKLNGSFIAVLNLTTDNAPTNPKDSANEVFTIAIIDATQIVNTKIVFPKETVEEKLVENLLNMYFRNSPAAKDRKSIVRPSKRFIWIEALAATLDACSSTALFMVVIPTSASFKAVFIHFYYIP